MSTAHFVIIAALCCAAVQVGAIVWFGIVTIRAKREAGQ
jgi:hypothetical protein